MISRIINIGAPQLFGSKVSHFMNRPINNVIICDEWFTCILMSQGKVGSQFQKIFITRMDFFFLLADLWQSLNLFYFILWSNIAVIFTVIIPWKLTVIILSLMSSHYGIMNSKLNTDVYVSCFDSLLSLWDTVSIWLFCFCQILSIKYY